MDHVCDVELEDGFGFIVTDPDSFVGIFRGLKDIHARIETTINHGTFAARGALNAGGTICMAYAGLRRRYGCRCHVLRLVWVSDGAELLCAEDIICICGCI